MGMYVCDACSRDYFLDKLQFSAFSFGTLQCELCGWLKGDFKKKSCSFTFQLKRVFGMTDDQAREHVKSQVAVVMVGGLHMTSPTVHDSLIDNYIKPAIERMMDGEYPAFLTKQGAEMLDLAWAEHRRERGLPEKGVFTHSGPR